jgi:hypothetical protein
LEAARRSRQSAQQKLASLRQQLEGIAANLNGNPNASIEQHPQYLDAIAQTMEAARELDHTIVRAPFDVRRICDVISEIELLALRDFSARDVTRLIHMLEHVHTNLRKLVSASESRRLLR